MSVTTPKTDTRGGLLGNSSALLGSRLLVAVLGWAGTILVVRRLDATEFGQFAFVFSLIGLLGFATDLSSSRIMVRALAQPGADRSFLAGAYLVLRLLLGMMTYAVAVAFVVVAGYPQRVVVATALAGLSLILGAAAGGLKAVFQAEVRLGHVALATVVGQVAQLALTVAIALTRPTLLLFVVPAVLFDLVVLAWQGWFVRRWVTPRLSFAPRMWADVLRQAAPLAVGSALFALSIEVPIVLLSKLEDFAAVGQYGIAIKFVFLAAFLPGALSAPLLPLLVRSWQHDMAAFRKTLATALLMINLVGGLIVVGFVPVAGDVVAFLYGEDYRPAALAAALLVTASCATFSTQVAIVVLITAERTRLFIGIGVLALLVSAGGTLALVPALSYEGAAVATATSQVLVLGVLMILARSSRQRDGLPGARLAGLAGCALAGVLLGMFLSRVAPWPVASVVAVLGYLGLVEGARVTGSRGIRSLREANA